MNRLPSIRRWGVAALTGVTLFGGLSIIGAGVASAATPTVSAALTAGQVVTPLSGFQTGGAVANLTLSINGVVVAGDQITLTLGCPTSGTAKFVATPTATGTGATWTAQAPVLNSTTGCSTETFIASAPTTATTGTIAVTGNTITTSGVGSQNLVITGTYSTLGATATSFTGPAIATVTYYTVSSNAPAVTLPASGTTALSRIEISQPTGLAATDLLSGALPGTFATVTPGTQSAVAGAFTGTLANQVINHSDVAGNAVTLTAGSGAVTSLTWTTPPVGMTLTAATTPSTGTPLAANGTDVVTLTGAATTAGTYPITFVATSGATTTTTTYNLVVAPALVTLTLAGTDTWSGSPSLSAIGGTGTVAIDTNTHVLDVTVTKQLGVLNSGSWTISGASVVTSSGAVGAHSAAVAYTNVAGNAAVMGTAGIGTVLGSTTTIYGADGTADGTVAAEFENAYPASSNNASSGNRNVILATDAPSANGADALSASYLEGSLGTGLLITPSTSLGADAKQAMQLEGVTTVYVVGGPLAISPAVIAQIKALPAYNAGGLTQTGSNVTVVGPIYGADGTAAGTAAAIATYNGAAYGTGGFAGAYSAAGGNYNDTTGSATATGNSGTVPTAIVVASSDWQDAMSVAPEAFNMRFPVILNGPSTDASLGADASAALTSLGVKQVIIIGGQLALQNSVETQIAALNGGISVLRIAGIDATDTAAQLANFALAAPGTGLGWNTPSFDSGHGVLASHVDYWTDALGAAALGGGANPAFGTQPMVLVESPLVIGQYTTKEMPILGGLSPAISNLTVLGGPLAMPSSTVQSLLAGL